MTAGTAPTAIQTTNRRTAGAVHRLHMCNPNLILGLMIAAEGLYGVAVTLLVVAGGTSGNFFTSGASPALLYAALASASAAVGFLGSALAQVTNCKGGLCGPFASSLINTMIGLAGAMTVLAGMIGFAIVPSAVAFLGTTLISIILIIALIACGALWIATAISFIAFYACMAITGIGRGLSIGTTVLTSLLTLATILQLLLTF